VLAEIFPGCLQSWFCCTFYGSALVSFILEVVAFVCASPSAQLRRTGGRFWGQQTRRLWEHGALSRCTFLLPGAAVAFSRTMQTLLMEENFSELQ